jgi:urease alpha subunit
MSLQDATMEYIDLLLFIRLYNNIQGKQTPQIQLSAIQFDSVEDRALYDQLKLAQDFESVEAIGMVIKKLMRFKVTRRDMEYDPQAFHSMMETVYAFFA